MHPIDWSLLSEATKHYNDFGFKYIEAPWIVSRLAVNLTLPKDKRALTIGTADNTLGYVVGSAEQSFIQLMLDNKISNGRYYTVGPCFRDEIIKNDLHFPYFMKLELIDIGAGSINYVLNSANMVMQEIGKCAIDIEKTSEGFDLTYKGIELGSYGMRKHEQFTWAYGTGLALPRFSQAVSYDGIGSI